jgi:hypothetical protein
MISRSFGFLKVQRAKSTKFGGRSDNRIRNFLIGIYILVILGISASARADFSVDPIFGKVPQAEIQLFRGEVALTFDGTSYLVVSENEFYELASSEQIDLTQYNGQQVLVNGFELKHKSGPVITTQALDPLDGAVGEKRGAHVLIVFEISEIAE